MRLPYFFDEDFLLDDPFLVVFFFPDPDADFFFEEDFFLVVAFFVDLFARVFFVADDFFFEVDLRLARFWAVFFFGSGGAFVRSPYAGLGSTGSMRLI